MRRVARVVCRRNQIWGRTDGHQETLVVVGNPEPAGDWAGGSRPIRNLANFLSGLSPSGWCHEVVCLENCKRHFMNECFFSESELGRPSPYGRLA